ncbi:hypothetical protein H632_c45p0 [Helicosporidium sp. ATCC 50920]|nr:hypothetical protein H632_c45p0 [Helicosporidium sp. ATCC 50920]|eukprot:KDD76994.1 hypothetical protein H632_c45p0 [Helicosporidium sp. ATCC 50920]
MSLALQKLAPLMSRAARGGPTQAVARRSFASDAHGEVKVNFWQAPTEVAKWKEEQVVLMVLAGWGVGIYSAVKIFGGKSEPKPAAQ